GWSAVAVRRFRDTSDLPFDDSSKAHGQLAVGPTHAVAAVSLGLVQGGIGVGVPVVPVAVHVHQAGADADRADGGHGLLQAQQVAGGLQHELGVAQDVVTALGHDQQAELVAAQAAGHVLRAGHRTQDAGDVLQHAVAGQVAVGVVDPLEAVAVHQQQADAALEAALAAVLQVLDQAAAVVEAGELVDPGQLLGLVELVGGGVEVVQGRFQVLVAAPELADQALLVQHHPGDGAAQELRDQGRVGVDQGLELLQPQLDQAGVGGGGGIGAAGVLADQQAQFAEELARPQALERQVGTEVQLDLALDHQVHDPAGVATAEQ